MKKGITLKIRGDYACFTRPEMKAERVSYDVITPSAARGLFEAIYFKPQIRFLIEEIWVLNPIQFTNIRRNEIDSKIPLKGPAGVNLAMKPDSEVEPSMDVTRHRQQRAALILRDVAYVIRAHIKVLDCRVERNGPILPENKAAAKHLEMFKRRARRGQCFHQPYLGCREYPASFELIESDSDIPQPDSSLMGERDLGYMLHDIDFDQDPKTKAVKNATPHFFRAAMKDGVIKVPPLPFPIKK